MISSIASLVICVIAFIMIWVAFEDSNMVVGVTGGLLFGGSLVTGVYHR